MFDKHFNLLYWRIFKGILLVQVISKTVIIIVLAGYLDIILLCKNSKEINICLLSNIRNDTLILMFLG